VCPYYSCAGAQRSRHKNEQLQAALAAMVRKPVRGGARRSTVVFGTRVALEKSSKDFAVYRGPEIPRIEQASSAPEAGYDTAAGIPRLMKRATWRTLKLTRTRKADSTDQLGGGFARYSVDGLDDPAFRENAEDKREFALR